MLPKRCRPHCRQNVSIASARQDDAILAGLEAANGRIISAARFGKHLQHGMPVEPALGQLYQTEIGHQHAQQGAEETQRWGAESECACQR
jgi:hypothetical protein